MRFIPWRHGLLRYGQPHFLLARWVTIAIAAAVVNVWLVGLSYAQDRIAPAVSKPEFQPAGPFPATGNRLAAYEVPAAPTPSPASESPLDRAVQEIGPSAPSQESPLDRAIRELGAGPEGTPAPSLMGPAPTAAAPSGGAQVKLINISLDGLFAGGWSTEGDPSLQDIEGGGHDPRKRGFTVRGVEFSLMGAVDPYLDGEMHLVHFLDPIGGETGTELEEAFMTTRALPHGLQLKAGQFLTEFGRINPTHPHAWAWLDQPIICTRVFGPDGMRGPGVRLSWLLPVECFSQVYFTTQNANGETMASFLANEEFFEERPIGGRPFVERDVHSLEDLTYTVRWETSWTTCCEEVTWLVGGSAAFGPNTTGPEGNTQIYGVDLTRKWKPAQNERGWPFTIWMSELIFRHYQADAYSGPSPADPAADLTLPAETLADGGLYTQLLYGFKPKWAVGLRYEFAWGGPYSLNSDYEPVSHNEDPFRDRRHRFSPLLAWYLTEFSRFNFQYNYDYAEHLPAKNAHSFWLGAEFMLGSHPAHKF